jgi:DNA-binding beta-propeller fold protein YncE
MEGAPAGMVLTHDGKTLIAAADDRVAFLDVDRLLRGKGDAVLGYLTEDNIGAGRIFVNISADDCRLFVSDEQTATITVIDVATARRSRYSATFVIGKISVGPAPIALTFSADGRLLYTTSQAAPATYGWPKECKREGANSDINPPNHTKGRSL